MNTATLFKDKTVFSFEVFPPKRDASLATIYKTLEELKGLNPDFISVTYGAGGSENSRATVDIAKTIKHDLKVESVAHLPCIGLRRDELKKVLDSFKEAGIENVLALRGDRREGVSDGDFKHASELTAFIRENYDFNVIGACYPEGHSEAESLVDDIRHLKEKVDAGASQLITQLFFDNECFYRFRERCELASINVPIEAGIMPVANKKQIERIVTLSGAQFPAKFSKILSRYGDNPEALRDAGIAYAIDQIVDLIAQGTQGIHLYTMNNPYIAGKISEAIRKLL